MVDKLSWREKQALFAKWNPKDLVDDGFPKWAPRLLRLTKDQIKLKRDFKIADARDVEYFAHYAQMGALIVSARTWRIVYIALALGS
jgi:hypothetical protein